MQVPLQLTLLNTNLIVNKRDEYNRLKQLKEKKKTAVAMYIKGTSGASNGGYPDRNNQASFPPSQFPKP